MPQEIDEKLHEYMERVRDGLSIRVYNVLRRMIADFSKMEPPENQTAARMWVTGFDRDRLLKVRGLGKKGLTELCEWCDVDEWALPEGLHTKNCIKYLEQRGYKIIRATDRY